MVSNKCGDLADGLWHCFTHILPFFTHFLALNMALFYPMILGLLPMSYHCYIVPILRTLSRRPLPLFGSRHHLWHPADSWWKPHIHQLIGENMGFFKTLRFYATKNYRKTSAFNIFQAPMKSGEPWWSPKSSWHILPNDVIRPNAWTLHLGMFNWPGQAWRTSLIFSCGCLLYP